MGHSLRACDRHPLPTDSGCPSDRVQWNDLTSVPRYFRRGMSHAQSHSQLCIHERVSGRCEVADDKQDEIDTVARRAALSTDVCARVPNFKLRSSPSVRRGSLR